MKTDIPPLAAERPVSCDKESRSVSTGLQVDLGTRMEVSLEVPKCRQDESPIKPLRRSWNTETDGAEIKEAESTLGSQIPTSAFDEKSVGHSTVFSDISDPSAFASMDTSFNNIDSSWRHDSIDTSLRIEALESLKEENDDFDLLTELIVRNPASSSSMDTAVFESAKKDIPPQLAVRYHSSIDSKFEIHPMDDRFSGIAPDGQDKPMTLPKPSYSQQQASTMPASSGLQKLAEAFISGCSIGTHSYHLKKYPNTFVGSQAVDFMLRADLASTREDAVFLGQRFCRELNLFHHVCWDHTFKDGQFFYRFNDECSKDVRCATPLSREDLVTMSRKFVKGMPVSKHKSHRFKTYRNTFSGEQAVSYVLQAKLATNRPDAVFLGQRMMEELDIFEPVSHNSRFKDSCYLYRFVTEEGNSSSCDDSATIGSMTHSDDAHHHQKYRQLSPLSPANTDSWSNRSSAIGAKRKMQRVTFGVVQSRYFERRLECNPATSSGPSLGLGWRFYDDSPVQLRNEKSLQLEFRVGRLSIQDRTRILKEWGYNKAEINKATRINRSIRQKRKQSLNNDTEQL
ncbi:unnamed protein product [Cylindrotheca closterium]|uniref:DEP domain-containing protein n=1 Tax=Cylindrotheca closterium TaxID=2856 RepID=A0AAD2JKN9_9STRA|nr:unnamed protein product [Cylindrotheca closterium]